MTTTAKKWLADRLGALRTWRGLTQEALAEKAGISYKYYQAIESGRKRDLRLSTLEKLAKAHRLTLAELLGDIPVPRLAEKGGASGSRKTPGPAGTRARVSYRKKK